MLLRVIAINIGDVFLRHSVVLDHIRLYGGQLLSEVFYTVLHASVVSSYNRTHMNSCRR